MGPMLVIGIVGYLIYQAYNARHEIKEKEQQKYKRKINSRVNKYKTNTTQRQKENVVSQLVSLIYDKDDNINDDVFYQMEQRQMQHDSDDQNDEDYFGRIEDEEEFVTMSPEVDDGEVFTDTQWESMASQQTVETKKQMGKRTPLQKAYILSEIFSKPKGLD